MNENDNAPVVPAKEDNNEAVEITPQGDELDSIDDVETLREKAKEIIKGKQSAYHRVKGELEILKKKPVVSDNPQVLTKEDFYKTIEKKAKRLVTIPSDTDAEEVKQVKTDIAENWDAVFSYYVPRSGKDTEEAVVEDLMDAHTIWRKKNPAKQVENKGDELSVTSGVVGKIKNTPTKPVSPPRFKVSQGPESWYPKQQ